MSPPFKFCPECGTERKDAERECRNQKCRYDYKGEYLRLRFTEDIGQTVVELCWVALFFFGLYRTVQGQTVQGVMAMVIGGGFLVGFRIAVALDDGSDDFRGFG